MSDQADVDRWMASMGFELSFDTGLKSYYSKKMQKVINAEAATFFYEQQQRTVELAKIEAQLEAFQKAINRGWCLPEMEVQVDDYIVGLRRKKEELLE